MTPTRRAFCQASAAAAIMPFGLQRSAVRSTGSTAPFDPWLEIDSAALRQNVRTIRSMTADRGILAVIKNNAYGLGVTEVAGILEPMNEIAGFAVVKADAALALRDAGVRKPVLVMGLFDIDEGVELVQRGVQLCASTDDAADRIREVGNRTGRSVPVHLYLDSGMGRMGIPTHRAFDWVADLTARPEVDVQGTFMAFTEEAEFDRIQLGRFLAFRDEATAAGISLGALHAASSNAVFHFPPAHLDLVRPGIAIFGAYPSRPEEERAIARLRCAVRFRARVVRVEQLRPGDSVSYGRNYVAEEPTWTATLPAGHVDGIPRSAVNGMQVLIGDRLYPVIGAVSASHCIIEVGAEPTVAVGDTATFVGPDRPETEPNAVAAATGASVYDVLMHLNPSLPRQVS